MMRCHAPMLSPYPWTFSKLYTLMLEADEFLQINRHTAWEHRLGLEKHPSCVDSGRAAAPLRVGTTLLGTARCLLRLVASLNELNKLFDTAAVDRARNCGLT